MKKLKEYKRNGFKFEVIERVGDYALAQGSRDGVIRTYEVFRVQSHNGLKFGGVDSPPAEHSPSNVDLVCNGWKYQKEAAARSRLYALSKNGHLRGSISSGKSIEASVSVQDVANEGAKYFVEQFAKLNVNLSAE